MAAAGGGESIADFLGRLASALSDGDAALFLSCFDPAMPGYARFRELVSALLGQAEVGCSIEILQDGGDDRRRELALDWMLEVSLKQNSAAVERRRATLKCSVERRGKNWKITALEPIDFFRAAG